MKERDLLMSPVQKHLWQLKKIDELQRSGYAQDEGARDALAGARAFRVRSLRAVFGFYRCPLRFLV